MFEFDFDDLVFWPTDPVTPVDIDDIFTPGDPVDVFMPVDPVIPFDLEVGDIFRPQEPVIPIEIAGVDDLQVADVFA